MKHIASQQNAVFLLTTSPFGSFTWIFSVPRNRNISRRRDLFSDVGQKYWESVAQKVAPLRVIIFCPNVQCNRFIFWYDDLVFGIPSRVHNISSISTRGRRTSRCRNRFCRCTFSRSLPISTTVRPCAAAHRITRTNTCHHKYFTWDDKQLCTGSYVAECGMIRH